MADFNVKCEMRRSRSCRFHREQKYGKKVCRGINSGRARRRGDLDESVATKALIKGERNGNTNCERADRGGAVDGFKPVGPDGAREFRADRSDDVAKCARDLKLRKKYFSGK